MTNFRFSSRENETKEKIGDHADKHRSFQFHFRFWDTDLIYPHLVDEMDLFSKPNVFKDYSIMVHAIRDEFLQDDQKVLFGLIDEENQSEYYVAWEVSLASLLFGPSEMCIIQTHAMNEQDRYSLYFHNKSSRIQDYYVSVHSLSLSDIPSSCYSYLYFSISFNFILCHF